MTINSSLKTFSKLLMVLAVVATAHADEIDISTTPLNTYSASSSTDVKPNIMFILDNSGSMAWLHMPDTSSDAGSAVPMAFGYYGYRSNQCNGVYYNPATNYKVPVKADGTSYPNATFTDAWHDGYKTGNGTVNLSTSFKAETSAAGSTSSGSGDATGEAAYYFKYKGSQNTESLKNYYDINSTFAKECSSASGATPGVTVFEKVVVSSTSGAGSTDERQNFANWYSYYRSRMMMMKTASGLAFKNIDDRYRVGFMTINNVTGSADFLNIADFNSATKTAWYDSLYGSEASGGTPLREALADMGRIYAGKLTARNGVTVTDPLQYSCQQNYAILSTDGFWNNDAGYKLNGSTSVGNQDGGLARPYYDGATAKLETQTSTLQKRTGNLQISTQRSNGAWRSWNDAATCQPGATTRCQYNWGTWNNTSSCTVNYSSGAGNWTIGSGTDCQYSKSSWSTVTSCTPVAESVAPNYSVATARACRTTSTTGGSSDSLADVAAYYYNTDLRDPDAVSPDATGTCTGPIISPNTTANDLCTNNVPANGEDVATSQHMTTFTLGLGVRGKMVYSPTYKTDTSGDYNSVKTGSTASSGICSWQASGACNWPIPGMNGSGEGLVQNVDDLWHAAVNGHGIYFSATNPDALSNGLTTALKTIINTPRPGTAAAAASSNPNVSASDNYVFSSSYKSVEWYGELIRQQITPTGGLTDQNWSAMRLLDCATTVWKASTSYVVGNVFRNGTRCYTVNTAYVSGATFNAASEEDSNTSVVNVDETATTKVPVVPLTSRTIYTKGASGLIPFVWTDTGSGRLSTTQQAYFSEPAITYVSATTGLSQFCSPAGGTSSDGATCLTTTDKTAAGGEALVNYLRGDRSNEGTYFRQRVHVLGDVVSSEARYVQAPLYDYLDDNYSQFKTDKSSRAGAVYVGANDGMLHAFNATTGQELWAYVPGMVLPELYKLADKSYATKHHYYVDNSPETGDICPNAPATTCTAGQWKTILVGGLNRGGKGYYALDITNPAAPTLLWEFTNTNLGYSYGNPSITKLKDGTWVVLVSSGYNNADGLGHLYVLNANTGAIIRNINTGVGSSASPSGLSRVSVHVLQSLTDNTARAAYGGDTLGNVWRFDINGDIGATGYDAQLLISLTDAAGKAQPVTVKPVQATINGKPVIFVGTGRYLGTSDVKDVNKQAFYAIKDNLDATTYGDPRIAGNNFIKQTLTAGTCPADTPTTICIPQQVVRTSSSNSVDWSTKNGWYVDFLTGGERSSTDPSLALGTLLFTTIAPQESSTNACGATTGTAASFVYALNYLTGGPVEGANGVSGISLGSGLVTRPVMILQADGTVRALIRTSSGASGGSDLGGTVVITPPINPPSAGGTRRVSWRVLGE